jgi:ribose 5-phosphate isomerase B
MDYPDVAHPVANAVLSDANSLGILICGSGNGVCLTANKHQGIRAALCWLPELGALARQHNNANILCLPARFISEQTAKEIVDAYLNAEFEGGRHQTRVDKIDC